MHLTLEFPDLVRLIEERSNAFVALVAAAADLEVPVPTCPGWTLFDLAQHVGQGRLRWAAIVAAGPADQRPTGTAPSDAVAAPREQEAMHAWLAASVDELDTALRDAGPDRGCWTWWPDSQSPQTAGAVARHQVQEVAVHTHDAQLALGAPQPLPDEVALDGVEEFLSTCNATTSPWPHPPAVLDYHATEGRSWRLLLSPEGARFSRLPATEAAPEPADASARGSASELVLSMYGRIPPRSLEIEGDPRVLDRLVAWDPSA
ncbi:MAG TPA: maleylpyruvate isomerase family mycothiol-dependent enzyme [Pedococcus sp.]|nr:maleylpyruvate isomerase family mycothiol-dependent enzyme [Pedococcus sp.]